MKTYQQWISDPKGRSMTQFLEIGDEVSQRIFDYVLEVLPPATWTESVLQMGEAFTHSPEGFPAFITLEKLDGKWTYTGVKTTPKRGLVAVELTDWARYQP